MTQYNSKNKWNALVDASTTTYGLAWWSVVFVLGVILVFYAATGFRSLLPAYAAEEDTTVSVSQQEKISERKAKAAKEKRDAMEAEKRLALAEPSPVVVEAPAPVVEPEPEPAPEPVYVAPAPVAVPDAGTAQSIAYGMLASYGWGEDQFPCLVELWNHESGWRADAHNAGSGAHGIPQALPGSKMASAGADWETNPATQIAWGMGYVSGRYGSPCGAWEAWQSKGWY